MKASDYIASFFGSHGVDTVFMVTGGGAMHLNDSFAKSPDFSVYYFHHEQAAAMAAEGWRERLRVLLDYPDDQTVQAFQRNTIHPAMQSFASALAERGVAARVITEDDALSVRLEVSHGDEPDFSYEVRARLHPMPDASLSAGTSGDKAVTFYRAEVHLAEGGQDYDVMGWSQEQVIVDILNQYEDHLHFLHTLRE